MPPFFIEATGLSFFIEYVMTGCYLDPVTTIW